jgi:DhnA family fructose-bisphosphate aldolase class Ia
MNNKSYRLKEFIYPADGRSLIVETSAGLTLGPLPGLEKFSEAVTPLLPKVEGVVCSPGQARKLSGRTRQDAALLVRADWTNALRGPDFVLPPETIKHIPLLSPQDALDLGASAIVLYFLLGHEEEIEAACLRRSVQAALEGTVIGMPLILDIQPIGPRVVLRSKAIELGVSYALESGADGVVIPWPGDQSFETIMTMAADMPVWLKPTTLLDAQTEISQAIELGAKGLWLGEGVFAQADVEKWIEGLRTQLHQEKSPLPMGEGKGEGRN